MKRWLRDPLLQLFLAFGLVCMAAWLLGCAFIHADRTTGVTGAAVGEGAIAYACMATLTKTQAEELTMLLQDFTAPAGESATGEQVQLAQLPKGAFCLVARGAKMSEALAGVINGYLMGKGIDVLGKAVGIGGAAVGSP